MNWWTFLVAIVLVGGVPLTISVLSDREDRRGTERFYARQAERAKAELPGRVRELESSVESLREEVVELRTLLDVLWEESELTRADDLYQEPTE